MRGARRHARPFRTQTCGASLIEFSLLLPVLTGLVFGLMEFGRFTYQKQAAEKGVKAAARYIARVVDTTGCPPTGAGYATAVSRAQVMAIYGDFDSNATPTLANWTNTNDVVVSVSCTSNAPDGTGVRQWRGSRNSLPVITVSTTFDFNDLGLLGALGVSDLQVSASHQELFIGG